MKAELSSFTVRELLIELDQVEQRIRSTTLYGQAADETPTLAVNPDLVELAERERAITEELASRRAGLNEWFAYRQLDLTRT